MQVKVLIVDDFDAFRQFVCSMLQKTAEFSVIGEASDGLEGLQKAEQLQPDVVLLDIGLPRLNGLQAARRISIVAPRAKILFVSENNDPDVLASALAEGAYGYVQKSAAYRELLIALEIVVGGKRFSSTNCPCAVEADTDPAKPKLIQVTEPGN